MENKEILNRLLNHKVAIMDIDTNELDYSVEVQEIAEGSGLFITLNEYDEICLFDEFDPNYEIKLGSTLEECLHELGSFEEYFNNLNEGWYSDFMYFFGK